jgi:hypothetical protein
LAAAVPLAAVLTGMDASGPVKAILGGGGGPGCLGNRDLESTAAVAVCRAAPRYWVGHPRVVHMQNSMIDDEIVSYCLTVEFNIG